VHLTFAKASKIRLCPAQRAKGFVSTLQFVGKYLKQEDKVLVEIIYLSESKKAILSSSSSSDGSWAVFATPATEIPRGNDVKLQI
jgi:hypothetical protein